MVYEIGVMCIVIINVAQSLFLQKDYLPMFIIVDVAVIQNYGLP